MKGKLMLLLFMNLSFSPIFGSTYKGSIDDTLRVLVKEYRSMMSYIGDRVWEDISETPAPLVLVTDAYEFLLYHPYPSEGFISLGFDTALETEVYRRERTFDRNILATFPAVQGVVCIVIGTPENTGKTLTDWLLTLIHERFHQYQMAQPNYFSRVEALDLSNGDQTGMWMLNYPFPYTEKTVQKSFLAYAKALQSAVSTIGTSRFKMAYATYSEKRRWLQEVLDEKDYGYFSFQLWQEGLSRHNEYVYGHLLKDYKISEEIIGMEGFTPIDEQVRVLRQRELGNLQNMSLGEQKRLIFYSLGFAEGLLLEAKNPDWRKKYFTKPFFIERYVKE